MIVRQFSKRKVVNGCVKVSVGSYGDSFTEDYYFNSKYYSFNTLNVSAMKRINKDLSVFAAVENILNKEIDDLYMFGRVWCIGAEMKF